MASAVFKFANDLLGVSFDRLLDVGLVFALEQLSVDSDVDKPRVDPVVHTAHQNRSSLLPRLLRVQFVVIP